MIGSGLPKWGCPPDPPSFASVRCSWSFPLKELHLSDPSLTWGARTRQTSGGVARPLGQAEQREIGWEIELAAARLVSAAVWRGSAAVRPGRGFGGRDLAKVQRSLWGCTPPGRASPGSNAPWVNSIPSLSLRARTPFPLNVCSLSLPFLGVPHAGSPLCRGVPI